VSGSTLFHSSFLKDGNFMKRKIIISILTLFIISALGSTVATVYIRNTTEALSRVLMLRQTEDLHRDLVSSIKLVQSGLHSAYTSSRQMSTMITAQLSALERAAGKCSSCHHELEISGQVKQLNNLIADYHKAVRSFLTSGKSAMQTDKLKLEAAALGDKALAGTQGMLAQASSRLESTAVEAKERIKWVWLILVGTVIATLVLGVLVAKKLIKSVIYPIRTLVDATRMIASGKLGYTINYQDKTEFGQLASHFNTMSTFLKNEHDKLEEEIIERKKSEVALRESEDRYALAARGANDGLWDWDLSNNRIYYSIRWKSMLGYEETEIGNEPEEWFKRIHPEDRKDVESKIAAHLNGRNPHFEGEYRILHKDGDYRWVVSRGIAVRNEESQNFRMAGSQTDITSRKKAEERLLYDAFHDPLTGLPNRSLFMDRLQHVITTSQRRTGSPYYAVLFLDMDRFKIINDSLGHAVGDQLLIIVGRKLTDCVRPGDTVARLGGDEFAIILENISDQSHAVDVAERVRKKLNVPIDVKGNELFTSASIGIALGAVRYERPEQVLRDADIAMYEAKGRGNASYEIFDTKMHANILDKLQLESDLRGAVDHKELVLYYQPIIDLKINRMTGFEALVRWNHPKRGLIYPLEFIPLAEEHGLIYHIGEWIFQEACRELKLLQERYPQQPPLTMSINISSKQFSQRDLVNRLSFFLRESDVDPRHLALEITESMIMENVDAAVEMMKQLRNMGIHIHIDDFGTGHSSLSYLHRFPVNALKIDRSFINKLSVDGSNKEIVTSIISLADSLHFDVIAEGVELEHQLSKIQDLKCGFGQGFLFARPMTFEALNAWMQQQKQPV
jgi:diguanylate cyclase (GGDEF)-like protein/PAS domain S-box-containing protein